MPDTTTRILIVHPAPETRSEVERAVRRAASGAVSVHQAATPAEALESARRIEPTLVFLELDEPVELVLDVARELRRPGRLLAGLYNPLLPVSSETEFFRAASRAGIADYVPLPPADEEVAAVMAAALPAADDSGREGRVAAFLSHKGGVGTTTLAVATALAAAADGDREVVLCDADLQFGDAAAHLGLAPAQDLAALARELGDLEALSAYLAVHADSGLRLLASPRDPLDADRLAPEELSRVLIALRRRFPLVVVDTASQIDLMSLAALDLADRLVVVTEPVTPTVLGTARLLELLAGQGFGPERVRVVLNQLDSGAEELTPEAVAEWLGRPADHLVEYDRGVRAGTNRGEPFILQRGSTSLARAAQALAREATEPRGG